jgi:hypothetical protein
VERTKKKKKRKLMSRDKKYEFMRQNGDKKNGDDKFAESLRAAELCPV